MANGDDALDGETHEKYLDLMYNMMGKLLSELESLREEIRGLPAAIGAELRNQ